MREAVGARRWRKWPWLALSVAMVVMPPTSWLMAHRLSSRAFPPAPWSESALPRIPPARVNGLDDVVLSPAWTLSTVDDDLKNLAGSLDRAHPPPQARDAESPETRWAEVVRRQDRVRDWMSPDALRRRELAQIDAVLTAPYFADPCRRRATRQCRVLELLNLAYFVVLTDLEAGLRGDWSQAFVRAVDLLLAAEVMIPTTRALASSAAALIVAQIAVDHLRVLLAGYQADATIGSTRTELIALRPVLEVYFTALNAPDALGRDDVSSRSALIDECHFVRNSLMPAISDPAANPKLPGGVFAAYLIDPRATIAASDAEFVALMRWVEAPDHATRPAPVFREYASGPGWWLWNPGGKQVLDLVHVRFEAHAKGMDRRADRLFVARAALRGELAALLR